MTLKEHTATQKLPNHPDAQHHKEAQELAKANDMKLRKISNEMNHQEIRPREIFLGEEEIHNEAAEI